MIIEGNVSVKAALLGKKREIKCIFVDKNKNDKDTSWILRQAKQQQIQIQYQTREEIDTLATGRTHGGLLAEVSSRIYQTKEDTVNNECPFVVLLEGVEDPFNLGYVMRTLYSAGCTGILLRNRNWENAESTIMKSSAGASEYINVVLSDDLSEDVKWYKKQGLKCFAAMRKDAVSCYECSYQEPCLIAIGGEMRGLSSKVCKEIDQNIFIPYANDFRNALNAAGASAVLGFEVYRQRNVCL